MTAADFVPTGYTALNGSVAGLPDLVGRTTVGWVFAAGQSLSVDNYLFGDLGAEQDENDVTLFSSNLPTSPPENGAPFSNLQPSLAVHCTIDMYGATPIIGEVNMFAWRRSIDMLLAGQLLSLAEAPQLFGVLGTRFGGDGVSSFRLPDLWGRLVVGAGQSLNDPSRSVLVGEDFGVQENWLVAGARRLPADRGSRQSKPRSSGSPRSKSVLAGDLVLGGLEHPHRFLDGGLELTVDLLHFVVG